MATPGLPAQRTNTWILNQWYDQAVAGTQEPPPPTAEAITLWGWGYNGEGQLAQNNTTSYSSPVQIPGEDWGGARFQTASPGNTFGQLNAGNQSGLITKTDGSLWWLGGLDFNYGTSGLNSIIDYSSPVQVGSDTNWGVGVGQLVSMSCKTDGTLWSWGRNDYGQLGLNTAGPTIRYSSPTQIGTDTTWNYVNHFGLTSLATKTDGSAWVWGYNEYGAFGNNTAVMGRSSPIQMGNTGDWTDHNGFALQSSTQGAAIKSDNTLWIWGNNTLGNLGQNNTTHRSSPVQIPGTWSSFTFASQKASAGIKTDGTLWAWGSNEQGLLGQNQSNPTTASSPRQIGTNTDWVRLGKAGNTGFSAVNSSKELYTWGSNGEGNLGLNDKTARSSPTQVPGTWYGTSCSYTGFGNNTLAGRLPG